MQLINARIMEHTKHCFLFQGSTQNLRISMKETPKVSFVMVAEEDKIKLVTFQNRIQNVSSTSACSKGRGGPCIECSEGILVYGHVMSGTGIDGFKVDSATAMLRYKLSPQKHFASLTCLCFSILQIYVNTI